MAEKQGVLFDDRFLESFAGSSILGEPKVAIIELVANAWDAGATLVEIQWPENDEDKFSVKDNGHSMTEAQFNKRFRTLAYNRIREQGAYAEVPAHNKSAVTRRPTFGKNGKGRLAAFAFGDSYVVITRKEQKEISHRISKDLNNALAFQKLTDKNYNGETGTEILIDHAVKPNIDADVARKEIGMRFLADPSFKVTLNNTEISFEDIPEENIHVFNIDIEGIGQIKITAIDVQATDRTTQQHGIAWHVKRRLVGECTWKGSGSEHLLDGRKSAAKRYVFIVEADCIEHSVSPDWTAFLPTDKKWQKVSDEVHKKIQEYILALSKDQRDEVFQAIEDASKQQLKKMGIVPREKWEKFIKSVQEECPSINNEDLEKVGKLLATLENSQSKFSLISLLAGNTPNQLDNLSEVLAKWDIDLAKIVLDEIEYRTTLLEKLQSKVLSHLTDEVQELQPLFHKGLWIFGPEYETIEYTSNQGMTAVVQQLFKDSSGIKGSRNRPDFAILPDSTVGLYSLPKYDEQGSEVGVDRLTIVELKKPGVPIGDEQKSQAWKYVSELFTKGLLKPYSKVQCFVLGSKVNPNDGGLRTEMDGIVKIQPLDYDIVIRRAKSRLLNLHEKIKHSPFLQDTRIRQYLLEKSELNLFAEEEVPF